ncbi:MAG: hypothetical protein ACOYNN_13610 [Terrimicrobiaceae bacterium]|jgi:hypothetical protein
MTISNSKKRGRPLGSKNKAKRGRPAAKKANTFKQFDVESRSLAKIVELEKIRQNLHNVIDNLEHQAVQYKAVISYLENKLENR